VSPDELSVVSWDTEDGHIMTDLQNNSCDQTGRLVDAGSGEPLVEQHPDYVEGYSYVPDIDLRDRDFSYNIFNQFGMLRRPYAGTQGSDEVHCRGLACGASPLSSTAEDREEYRSDAGVTRRSDGEMRRRGITR